MDKQNETSAILQVLKDYRLLFANSDKITLDKLSIYAKNLNEYNLPASLIEMILRKLTLTETFFPAFSTIISMAREFINIANNKHELDADEAWLEVQQNISTYLSPTKTITWSSLAIKHAVSVVSWDAIIHSSAAESGMVRAQFRDAYNAAVSREKHKQEIINSFALLDDNTRKDLMSKIVQIGTISSSTSVIPKIQSTGDING